MARNVIQHAVTISTEWQALAAKRQIMDATLSTAADNQGGVLVRLNEDDATIAAWFPGVTNQLMGVDLATIEVKGTAGDRFLVVAQSA